MTVHSILNYCLPKAISDTHHFSEQESQRQMKASSCLENSFVTKPKSSLSPKQPLGLQ